MARRIMRQWDSERTDMLGQNELFVQKGKGSKNYLYAWHQEPEVESCPLCAGEALKMQDMFSKTYRELIHEDGRTSVVMLEYGFPKYRCLNSECRHIFAKEINFASKYGNVTYRLENEIARLVISGLSYGAISDQFQVSITRQAVGQIFNRWVRRKDELRRSKRPPTRIAVLSGMLDKSGYTLILNLDDGISIYDVLYGIGSSDISAVLRNIGLNNISSVLSDCNPTITETLADQLPNAIHIIPVQYWFKLVSDDFAEFSHELIKWSTVPNKDELILQPDTGLGLRGSNLERLFQARPAIQEPHRNFNDLRALISRRDEMWVFEEIVEWTDGVEPNFKKHLGTTIDRLNRHRKEIEAHVHYRELVPEQLYAFTEALEHCLAAQRVFSPEVLRARVLYSVDTDLENWNGVPIENVIDVLNALNGGNTQ